MCELNGFEQSMKIRYHQIWKCFLFMKSKNLGQMNYQKNNDGINFIDFLVFGSIFSRGSLEDQLVKHNLKKKNELKNFFLHSHICFMQ